MKIAQLKFAAKQTGSTLIVTMIVLILIMLLGVAAINTSDMQYKLTGNLQFEEMAMNNAETAVNAAERWLETVAATQPSASSVADLSSWNKSIESMTWDNSNSSAVVGADGTANGKQRYVIAYVSTNASPLAGIGLNCFDPANEHNFDCVNTYVITGRGESGRGAVKFIQTYYAVPLK